MIILVVLVVLEQKLRWDMCSGSDPRLEATLIMCSITHYPYKPHLPVVLLSFGLWS